MENNCNIIEDILPLYVEDMVSADTKAFVENHVANCAACHAKLEQMRHPPAFVPTGAVSLKKIKEKLLLKRIQTIFFTAALVFAIAASVFSIITSPQFFPYSDDLMQVTENQAGTITITFDRRVTRYGYIVEHDEETGIEIYRINAWNTIWDMNFSNRGEQNMVLTPTSTAGITVYYAQNDGSEDVLIYGLNKDSDSGSITLPRLILTQYFLLALLTLIVFCIVRFLVRRQKTVKTWVNRLLLFPVSYMIAHLLIKGLTFQSYSAQRDFSMIVLVAILLYCAMLSGGGLYQSKKRGK